MPKFMQQNEGRLEEGGAACVVTDMEVHRAASAEKAPFPRLGRGPLLVKFAQKSSGVRAPHRTDPFEGSMKNCKYPEKGEEAQEDWVLSELTDRSDKEEKIWSGA